MKAIVCTRYGLPDVLEPEEVEKPEPRANEVLVKVHAATVNTQNMLSVSGKPGFIRLMGMGLFKPSARIPGNDIAGTVEAVGKKVRDFRPGDGVFGDLSQCGHGTYAEYVCAPEAALALKPANAAFEEAAGAGESALVALQGLRDKGRIQKGQKLLIYGASGGVGSFAVQIAKYYGAEVTGICSTRNMDLLRSLGADHVIDYTKEDYSWNGLSYDMVFAVQFRSIRGHLRALGPQGKLVTTGGPDMHRIYEELILGPFLAKKTGKKILAGWTVKPNRKDLTFIKELMEAGKIRTVIDKRFPLRETARAIRYYGEGHTRGKVILTIAP